ncbi:MAG: AraC family transcriptional regulator [Kangiellaceae bacterium]|nr:AraC family transcriptional regulator [Kangiellaceae bacterium]MCW8997893.1 AraC family transcriptional regulator [Kangiellaceae bacterium]MCW9017896.1 AraC family transcriptional regulator [Kangiellaceae bacterium]
MKSIYRLDKIKDYCLDNLDKDLSLDTVSRMAGVSRYHLHRLFNARFGINLGELVTNARMHRSCYQLVFRKQLSVLDVALEAGFSSHEAFSRRFKSTFGISPRQFRNEPNSISVLSDSTWIQQFNNSLLQENKMEETLFDFKVMQVEPVNLIEYRHVGAQRLLPESISEFIVWRKKNRLHPSRFRTFNLVYCDPRTTPDTDFQFGLASEVNRSNIPLENGYYCVTLPEGSYIVYSHLGDEISLGRKVEELYQYCLNNDDFELADFPMVFERKSFYPEVAINQQQTDILLLLK